ncbi:MAG: cytochrome c3 family protein [Acidobacteriota bacterium]
MIRIKGIRDQGSGGRTSNAQRPTFNVERGRAVALAVAVLVIAAGPWGTASGQETLEVIADAPPPPVDCVFPSKIGEVTFPHQMHVEDFEMECVACHHEVNAERLHSPHEEYFEDFWIRCSECHHDKDDAMPAKKCSTCHHPSHNVIDQTLSAKVVVHRVCSECHEIGTGATASASCELCHTGPRLPR